MSWADRVKKNMPQEQAPIVAAPRQQQQQQQQVAHVSTSASSSRYDTEFPQINTTATQVRQQVEQQQQQQAVAVVAEPVVDNTNVEVVESKQLASDSDNRKSFNKDRRQYEPRHQDDRRAPRRQDSAGNHGGHYNRRPPRDSAEAGAEGDQHDRRPPRHQDSAGNQYERRAPRDSAEAGAEGFKKFDRKAKKLEEEAQLRERFQEPKQKLCFDEVQGDLFSVKDTVSLAHCVSGDLEMGQGIAVEFKDRFGQVEELLKHHPRVGKCSFLRDKQRSIFYLVTKRYYYHKPTYASLEDSLRHMRELCEKFRIGELAMPRIGCGLDLLEWDLVSRIIDDVFANSNTKITVYYI